MFDSAESQQKLEDIVELFTNVKSIIIYAEEIATDFDTYPQILLELRNTLDHFLRAVSGEINPEKFEVGYAIKSLDKAYSHLFRAAYDALDWSGIALRENILEELKGFCPKTIDKAIPDYYPKMRPDIDEINKQISILRNEKDIASINKNLQAFGKYLRHIETLKQYYDVVVKAKPSLIELEGDVKSSSRRFWIGTTLITIAGVIITAIVTYYLTIGH